MSVFLPPFLTPAALVTDSACIAEFTGISAPYEAPKNAEIHVNANTTSVEDAVEQIVKYLVEKGIISHS